MQLVKTAITMTVMRVIKPKLEQHELIMFNKTVLTILSITISLYQQTVIISSKF